VSRFSARKSLGWPRRGRSIGRRSGRTLERPSTWACHVRRACRVYLGVVAGRHAPAYVLRLPLPTRHHPACCLDVSARHAQLPRRRGAAGRTRHHRLTRDHSALGARLRSDNRPQAEDQTPQATQPMAPGPGASAPTTEQKVRTFRHDDESGSYKGSSRPGQPSGSCPCTRPPTVPRHLVSARTHRLFRAEAFEAWRNAAGVPARHQPMGNSSRLRSTT
jgi:hypothetical protein